MSNSKQIVYLSQSQYAELIANGTITVNGVTVTYDENDIYVTPQAEPVTDVRVAGTSVAANGVANIPIAENNSTLGVVTTDGGYYGFYGLTLNNGVLRTSPADTTVIKGGSVSHRVIDPNHQHESTFYGLAKASGDTTQSQSSNAVGSYTPEAKGAIQQMLGVSNLIATAENSLVASKAYAVGDVFTANGKLYKVTSAIAATETIVVQNEGEEVSGHNAVETNLSDGFVKKTDYATGSATGVIKVNSDYGLRMGAGVTAGTLLINGADETIIKNYVNPNAPTASKRSFMPLTPSNSKVAIFYGMANLAGDVTQSSSSNAVGTYTNEAKAAIKSMIGVNVEDVQIGGTSVIADGIANIPIATSGVAGVLKVWNTYGVDMISAGNLRIFGANESETKAATHTYRPIVPAQEHSATFYGLAKASGDTTQSASSNAVGVYTDNAKASIKSMLGIVDGSTGTVDISGTTPTITAVENTRYVCGEVSTLSFTPPASGISIVRFTSGTTATVLTLPSTVKFPEWFDPTTLETDTIYEICITDGIYGAVMSWAQ